MLDFPIRVGIYARSEDDTYVPTNAQIHALDSHKEASDEIDAKWWLNEYSEFQNSEPDGSWIWADLVQTFSAFSDIRATVKVDVEIEGAIILGVNGCSRQTGDPVIFVHRLASAPRNRSKLGGPKYKEVGERLINYAALVSYQHGLEGRMTLFSTREAVTFYERLGFKFTGITDESGLRNYELDRDEALSMLDQFGMRASD